MAAHGNKRNSFHPEFPDGNEIVSAAETEKAPSLMRRGFRGVFA
jgi:hypothetical protein